ncbi:MAG: hypothetical protein ACRD0G_17655 [Acidimicrobiales bacterium]
MTPTLTRSGRPRSKATRPGVDDLVVAVVYLLVCLGVASSLRLPPYVDRVTVENPHPWRARVLVTNDDGDGRVGMGGVQRDETRTFRTIVDQGDVWIVTFGYAGVTAELTIDRRTLASRDWTVTVPDSFARQLQDAGVPHSAP